MYIIITQSAISGNVHVYNVEAPSRDAALEKLKPGNSVAYLGISEEVLAIKEVDPRLGETIVALDELLW